MIKRGLDNSRPWSIHRNVIILVTKEVRRRKKVHARLTQGVPIVPLIRRRSLHGVCRDGMPYGYLSGRLGLKEHCSGRSYNREDDSRFKGTLHIETFSSSDIGSGLEVERCTLPLLFWLVPCSYRLALMMDQVHGLLTIDHRDLPLCIRIWYQHYTVLQTRSGCEIPYIDKLL